MATNDFIGFASSGNANVMSQADYAAAHEQLVGVQPGMASSAMANKVWRQGANIAAVIGELIKNHGIDALDNGDLATLYNALLSATASATLAGWMSAEDKTALDNVPTTYFPLAGGTITGQTKIATSNNDPGIFQIANTAITKGTAPSENVYTSLGFFGDDQSDYTKLLGVLELVYGADKSVEFILGAYKANTLTDTDQCAISCKIYPDGTVSTSAPTPATTDNSTKIATTEFVENRLNYIENKSLTATEAVGANYSACAVQGHVCYISLSFELSATPTNWSEITVFKSPVLPKFSINGAINTQDGVIGGLYLEILTNGDINLHFTGGQLPTDSYYHGILVFPC